MKIVAADDEELALKMLEDAIRKAEPSAELHLFDKVSELLSYVQEHGCDVAFLDIEMRGTSGLEAAIKLKVIQPDAGIIFATGYSEYKGEPISLRTGGYVLKPATPEDIRKELEYLKHPTVNQEPGSSFFVRTFGAFEVLYGGKSLVFPEKESKELFAFLIHKRGEPASFQEIALILFQNREYDRTVRRRIQRLLTDLEILLRRTYTPTIFLKERNSAAVDVKSVECDYYQFLNGNPDAINSFRGNYMTDYVWAEFTAGSLSEEKEEGEHRKKFFFRRW